MGRSETACRCRSARSNTGNVASAVAVQAYCGYLDSHRKELRIMRYARMLCAFDKVFLKPGSSATVQLAVTLRTLARYDPDGTSVDLKGKTVRGSYVVDAGRYTVAVGDCSAAGSAIGLHDAVLCAQQHANFTVAKTVEFNGKH